MRLQYLLDVLIVLTLIAAALQRAPYVAAAEPYTVYLPLVANINLAEQVIQQTNQLRAAHGCPAVTSSLELVRAAEGHSQDMAAHNHFDHIGTAGDGIGQRATAAGYRWTAISENIAAGQGSAEAVFSSWIASAGHRANMLDCTMQHIGVGIASGSQGIYWTQMFGRP
jgi:uncharacterized protein YkwD